MKYLKWSSKKCVDKETISGSGDEKIELQKILEQYSTEFEDFFESEPPNNDVTKRPKWKLYQQVQLKLGQDVKYDYDYENKIFKVACDQCSYVGQIGTDLYYHKRNVHGKELKHVRQPKIANLATWRAPADRQIGGSGARNLRARHQKQHTIWTSTSESDAQEIQEGSTAFNIGGVSKNEVQLKGVPYGNVGIYSDEKNGISEPANVQIGIQNEQKYSEEEDFYPSSEKTSENGEIEKMEQIKSGNEVPKHFIQNDEKFTQETYFMSQSSDEVNYIQKEENNLNLNELTEKISHKNEENDRKDDDDWQLFHGDFFTSY